MDKYYPKNIDPRPHRRHNKDNPYTIFTVGINTGTPHYYVSFTDGQGVRICMEIEKSIYELLDKFELEDLSYLNEVDRHYEHSELTEITLNRRAVVTVELVEDIVEFEALHTAIKKLPRVQRNRLMLYYFYDMTLEEIAEREKCSVQAVSKSILAAEKNLIKFLSEG